MVCVIAMCGHRGLMNAACLSREWSKLVAPRWRELCDRDHPEITRSVGYGHGCDYPCALSPPELLKAPPKSNPTWDDVVLVLEAWLPDTTRRREKVWFRDVGPPLSADAMHVGGDLGYHSTLSTRCHSRALIYRRARETFRKNLARVRCPPRALTDGRTVNVKSDNPNDTWAHSHIQRLQPPDRRVSLGTEHFLADLMFGMRSSSTSG